MKSSQTTATQSDPWVMFSTRIVEIISEVPGIATYRLKFDEKEIADSYRFQPGQFNMLYLPGAGEAAISISSDPEDMGNILHTVRVAGNVTRTLANQHVNDQIFIRGPFGKPWPIADAVRQNIVIACGGIGIAPLRPMIYHIVNHREDFGRVILLYGARTSKDLLYTNEFENWQSQGIEMEVTVDLADQDWQGNIGVVPSLFSRLKLDRHSTTVFTCGPEIMMRFVSFESLARKISPDHIYLSMERNMNCAAGFCGHCQLGPAFVCKDGPVFTYRQMEPYLQIEDL